VIPTLGIPAKRRTGPFQNQPCHLFHLFYQVQIRLGTRRRLKNRGRGPTTPIIMRRSSAMLTAITPEPLATAEASRFLLNCQQFFVLVKQHKRETTWTCLRTDQRARVADLIVANFLVLSGGCSKVPKEKPTTRRYAEKSLPSLEESVDRMRSPMRFNRSIRVLRLLRGAVLTLAIVRSHRPARLRSEIDSRALR
jgi:hypothetical protein